MNKLLFHWDENQTFLADEKAQERLLKLWTHTVKAFGIYHLLVIGSAPANNDLEMTIESFVSVQDARDAYPDEQYVVLVEGGVDVDSFVVPTGDLIFTLGSNYSNPIVNDGDLTIGLQSEVPLWDVVAAGIVLYKVS